MYEDFYRLRARPFSKTPDPAFLFTGRRHGEALARLELAAADKDTAILTGEIGAGKTTLSRALLDRLDDTYRVVLIINPRLTAAEVLTVVAEKLGLSGLPKQKTRLVDLLTERLYALYAAGEKPLVIVDEAHLITQKAVFEELRLLTNLQLDDASLMGLLLIGQPELRDTLAKPALKSFAQRIGMAYHLTALDEDETAAYVLHRLAVAGRTDPLFTTAALQKVYAYSQGVPRRINTLCQGALLSGLGTGAVLIDADIVDDVQRDLLTNMGEMWSGPRASSRRRQAAHEGAH